jgi:hypothetical protein
LKHALPNDFFYWKMVCLFQVYAEKLHIKMDDIGEGIVALVYQHSIKKLVIGAAADKHYSGY